VDPEFAFVDPVFIDTAVDFIHTYATAATTARRRTSCSRHWREKDLSPEHRQIMKN